MTIPPLHKLTKGDRIFIAVLLSVLTLAVAFALYWSLK